MLNAFINVKWYSWRAKFSFANYFCFITLRRATKRKLDILKVKGSRRCLPKGGPAIAFRERYAHLHCVTSPLSVSLYVLQSRCALHVVIPSLRVFFSALSIPPSLPPSLSFHGDFTLIRPYPGGFCSCRSSSLSYAPLPSRPNEQRRAGSSTSLLIKWPRESAPGFFNDEILLAAASRRQFSFARRRKTMRHETRHRMIMRRLVLPLPKNYITTRILLQQKLLQYFSQKLFSKITISHALFHGKLIIIQ